MSHNWGYKQAKKDAASCGMARGGKVAVKSHVRAPRSPKAPPVATPPSKDIPGARTSKKKP